MTRLTMISLAWLIVFPVTMIINIGMLLFEFMSFMFDHPTEVWGMCERIYDGQEPDAS